VVICVFQAIALKECSAQEFNEDDLLKTSLLQETINSGFFGADARSIALGNTGIVTARDGSALIYNPASLARVRRIEFRAGLSHLRQSYDSQIRTAAQPGSNTYSASDNLRKTRISALSLTMPIPTYRGSLVAAFGLHRVNSFDHIASFRIPDLNDSTNVFKESFGTELEEGGLWKWSAGAGMDISPRLSAGLSLHLLTGEDKYNWTRRYVHDNAFDTTTLFQGIDVDYLGAGATVGLNYQVSEHIASGVVIETPSYLVADESFDEFITVPFPDTGSFDFAFSEYSIIRPFKIGFGISGNWDVLTLVSDFRYTDWSQLGFNYDLPGFPDNREDEFIQKNLTEALGVHLGGELILPDQGASVRLGYSYDPLPVHKRFVESQRQYISAGLGFLIDRVMTLDMAYVYGGYKLRDSQSEFLLSEEKTSRIFLTFAYRI
jgi:long-subunit fatty acid transport protein